MKPILFIKLFLSKFQTVFKRLNFRRMSSRVDAVSQRVQTAVTTKKVTQSMASVVNSMEAAMRSMNLEQVRFAV